MVALFILIGHKSKIFNVGRCFFQDGMMKKDTDSLEMRLKELDEKIKAVEKQLPAHSVKPPIMAELFKLEDERNAVFEELERLKHPGPQ